MCVYVCMLNYGVTLVHANLCTHILVYADDYMAFKYEVHTASPCVDVRSRRKNYSVQLQVFKT